MTFTEILRKLPPDAMPVAVSAMDDLIVAGKIRDDGRGHPWRFIAV